jgi:hypothetical protein
MIFQCTGGGLLVPIFINAIPVSLGNDAYPICIFASTLLHMYCPILRDAVSMIPMLKVSDRDAKKSILLMNKNKQNKSCLVFLSGQAALVVLFETQRASVVVKLTKAAAAAIPATNFSFPLFGPIFCGALAGCGGSFLPLTNGLAPLEHGLAPNMLSALVAATFFHLFLNTSLSDNVTDAAYKAQVVVACGFIGYSLVTDVGLSNLFVVNNNDKKKGKMGKPKKE